MKCRHCGAELEPEARFCQDCGTPVGSELPQSTFMPAQANIGKRRSPRTIAIGVICVAAIVAVALGAATLLGLGKTSTGNASRPSSTAASSAASSAAADSSSASSSSASSASASASSASAASSESSAASDSSSSAASEASDEPGWDGIKAEAKARHDAEAAGMQVLTGTVHITTYGEQAAKVSSKLEKSFADIADWELALFEFSMLEDLSAASASNGGIVETRSGQESISLGNPWEWEEFDGQLVTIAAFPQDLLFPGNVARKLYSAAGNALLIAPLTESRDNALSYVPRGQSDPLSFLPDTVAEESRSSASASASASAKSASASSEASPAVPDGDYVLPNSSTHAYTKAELAKLSDYELFIARNEIYARHGRKFQSADLQSYFDSKSWYKGTTDPSAFDESVLSDAELANASLIREVEQARSSKYL